MDKTDYKKINDALFSEISNYTPDYSSHSTGRVLFSGDGVIKIGGMPDAKYGELLDVEGKYRAIVLDLEENEVGAIVLDAEDAVSANMLVKSTGHIVEVPVGKEMFGRVVDPLGNAIDGLGEIHTSTVRAIEASAPSIADRAKVEEPLMTGIIAIDSMIPIGKGQRELIIGDRQTGKTSIAVDAILNQKGKDVYCVYVAIGQKTSTVSSVVHTLERFGALEYTSVVCSTAHDSAPLQYIAPFTGCAIAEEMMYSGHDVLIVYDDLSKHAIAYRAMSLLLKRPPGREAFPGDIFYLHSRLLERAAKLNDSFGGGSMTALPIIETLAGDISAYVPTNVISITDGQIYLESELFNSGVRPAVNVGLSVSRVGGSAQVKGIRKVGGKLRLYLSQYRELSVFAQFGSELDGETTAMLEKGARITEALKQDVRSHYDTAHEIIVLYIAMKELLKEIPTNRVSSFVKAFTEYLDIHHADIVNEIEQNGDIGMEAGLVVEKEMRTFADYYFKEENR
ncbi:MAG: F0F1 ATP synthase subunit alpha [Clostridia bacterium]|nr:F0F1 ATP synthase subunit alpha [Clostridia bacterium]